MRFPEGSGKLPAGGIGLCKLEACATSLGRKVAIDLAIERHHAPKLAADRQPHSALCERADDFLGRDVSHHLVLGKRTSAQAAQRRIETPATGIVRRQHFARGFGPRAVEVDPDLVLAALPPSPRSRLLGSSPGRPRPTVSASEIERTPSAAIARTASTRRSLLQRSWYGLPKAIEM